MRVKAIVRYDGTSYYGFQIQTKKEEISIQGEICKVLNKIFNRRMDIFASGRTDKKVHALNQVFHFDIDADDYDLGKLKYSMNLMLPKDICILSLERVNDDFHARYSVIKKQYRYIVLLKDDPFYINYAYICHYRLDIQLIKKGMDLFLGQHDFMNFCSIRDFDTSFIENIFSFDLKIDEDMLIFDIIGSGFKRYMVRMIIGTLLMLGREKIDLDYIRSRLDNNQKLPVPYKAEPQGLYLVKVFYD